MIEAQYTIEVAAPPDLVWSYVEDIPRWAPFMVGFQKLEVVDDRRSVWTLRGDVGVLAREVDIQADITAWEPPKRAEFTVTGLTERLTGTGWFELSPADTPMAAPVRLPWWRRLRHALARRLLRRLTGRRSAPAMESTGPAQSRLTFHIAVAPGGPMAPMVELLMRPMVEPAAEDFLRELRRALEQEAGVDGGRER